MKKYFFIFFSNSHNYFDDFLIQKYLIEETKPKYVLLESLENNILKNKKDYENFFNKKSENFKEINKLVKFCYKKNIQLIGIDLKNHGFNNNLIKKIKEKKFSKKDEKEIIKISLKREKHMYKKIKEYKNKEKPILIFIGAYHLRKNSILRKIKNSLLIYYSYKNGKMILGSTDKKPLLNFKEL